MNHFPSTINHFPSTIAHSPVFPKKASGFPYTPFRGVHIRAWVRSSVCNGLQAGLQGNGRREIA